MSPVLLLALAALAFPGAGAALAADPLKSFACGRSLAALQAARATAGRDDVEAIRREAAQACLGGQGEAQRPAPTAQPPLVVPPPVVEPPVPPPAAVAAPAPPPVAIEQPPVVTSCDAAGCWTSEGTRLNRSGPLLIGPGGACVTSGHVVRCP
ncbi:hypothetical protein [Ramlibacter sp.]|uniref:hypothetical protein n=1 Tax=Ramlibacter sp. TaxID=1917967 RepID=UPI002FCAD5F0